MDNLWIAVFILGGLAAIMLTLLLLRGRFGTVKEQGEFELLELANSDEVPKDITSKEVATCRGHTLDSRQMLGAGVLWMSRHDLGFVLRTPRRHFRVPLRLIERASVASSFSRPGIEEFSDQNDFMVVEWMADDGTESIVWQLPEPQRWVDLINRVRG